MFMRRRAQAGELNEAFTRLTDRSRSPNVGLKDRQLTRSDQARVSHREPEAASARRVLVRFLAWLPIEHQL